MWNIRNIIRTNASANDPGIDLEGLYDYLPLQAMPCVSIFMSVSFRMGQFIPLSMHAAHFLLHHWVYEREASIYKLTALSILFDGIVRLDDTERGIIQFVKEYTAECHADHPSHLMPKLSRTLRDSSLLGDSLSVVYICIAFARNGPAAYYRAQLLEGHSLIPSLIINCERQMCSPESSQSHQDLVDQAVVLIVTLESGLLLLRLSLSSDGYMSQDIYGPLRVGRGR